MEKIKLELAGFVGLYWMLDANGDPILGLAGEYHRASEVDALLSDVLALVANCKQFNEVGWTQRGFEDLLQKQEKAIAAVERRCK